MNDAQFNVSDAVVTVPMAGRDISAGYMTLRNVGADDRLIGASSPRAETIELHTHRHENGVMSMREVDAIDLPSGEAVTFERGGLHLMLFGSNVSADMDTISVTLDFEIADDLTIDLAVR